MYQYEFKVYQKDKVVDTKKIMVKESKIEDLEKYDYFVIEGDLYEKWHVEDGYVHGHRCISDVYVAYGHM
jgi:hypothetical protein